MLLIGVGVQTSLARSTTLQIAKKKGPSQAKVRAHARAFELLCLHASLLLLKEQEEFTDVIKVCRNAWRRPWRQLLLWSCEHV